MQNTSDPAAYQNVKQERAGAIASDSLAAESTRSGGGFSTNLGSEPLSVKGSSSNFANTETSGATRLPPAANAAERDDKGTAEESPHTTSGPGGQKYPEGAGGQGEFPGAHNADGYSGGSTRAKQELASKIEQHTHQHQNPAPTIDDQEGEIAKDAPSRSYDTNMGNRSDNAREKASEGNSEDNVPADAAPSYVRNAASDQVGSIKPKGKNITEGGFDDDADKNVSFTSDIGSENDPGRAAESVFQKQAQKVAGGGPTQTKITNDGQYAVLDEEQGL